MNAKFKAEYKAGGYPNPTYTGIKTGGHLIFGMDFDEEDDYEDVLAQARQRARRIIAHDGCFSLERVTITDISFL